MKKREFRAILPELEEMILFILDFIEEKSDNKLKYKFRLISEEILVNIINYGFEENNGKIEISCEWISENIVEVTIKDNGKEFNPLKREEPDVTKPIEEKEIGGLGIFMVKKLADKVYYEYKDKKNVLTFQKEVKL